MEGSTWNDYIVLCVKGVQQWFVYAYIATCDPSAYWSSNANRKKQGWSTHGAFHLSYGFHENIWMIGTHRGYTALSQWGAKVSGWRDANEDFLDNDEEYMREHNISNTGFFGINCHHGGNAKFIGLYGAGCQVIRLKKLFKQFLKHIMSNFKYVNNKKARYSYLLKNITHVPKSTIEKIREMAV